MKVKKIRLKNEYLNFENNFTLDFVYPSDYYIVEKRDKPLDKVCFIGQSGTGKTTLLNLIKLFSFEKENINKDCIEQASIKNNVEVFFEMNNSTGTTTFHKKISDNNKYEYYHEDGTSYKDFEISHLNNHILDSDSNPWLINFPFDIINEKSINKNISTGTGHEMSYDEKEKSAKNKKVWDFSLHDNSLQGLSDILFEGVSKYNEELKEVTSVYHANLKAAKEANDSAKALQLISEFEKWKEEHDDIFKILAKKCLNPILLNFNMEVDPNIDLGKVDELKHITLRHINTQKVVPNKFLSTGIHQLLKSAIPLHFLSPTDTIILFDQPESSLYPDIQFRLINEYEKLTKKCQIFYATHSPIIASAFQPCEIFELYFKPDGKVSLLSAKERDKKYGTNLNPQLLTWDSIYMKFFGLKTPRAEEGMETLKKLAIVENRIKIAKEKDNRVDVSDLIEEYKKIAKSLDWNLK